MKINQAWFRRRWSEGRNSQIHYLIILLSITNFILITFRFLIEQRINDEIFLNLFNFGVIFLIFYIPISILIGKWHIKNQLSTDNIIKIQENPIFARIARVILDYKLGKIDEIELEKVKKYLIKIEKNSF